MPSYSRFALENATTTIFVRRLERLIRLRRDRHDDLNPLGVELLNRSIYATYRDCVDFGAGTHARLLMLQAGLNMR